MATSFAPEMMPEKVEVMPDLVEMERVVGFTKLPEPRNPTMEIYAEESVFCKVAPAAMSIYAPDPES